MSRRLFFFFSEYELPPHGWLMTLTLLDLIIGILGAYLLRIYQVASIYLFRI